MTDYEIEQIYNESIEGEDKTAFDGLRAVAAAARAELLPLLEKAAPFLLAAALESRRAYGSEDLPIDHLIERIRAVLLESEHD